MIDARARSALNNSFYWRDGSDERLGACDGTEEMWRFQFKEVARRLVHGIMSNGVGVIAAIVKPSGVECNGR